MVSLHCCATVLALAICLGCCAVTTHAQPFVVAGQFAPELSEPAKRNSTVGRDGFVFSFNNAKATAPNGNLVSDQVGQNPFLSTLPNDGISQALIVLGPCATNAPHTHPRGTELAFVVSGGNIKVAFVEENGGRNVPREATINKGETVTFPQGLIHWQYNDNCSPATLIASFPNKDPGAQTVMASVQKIPPAVLTAATGVPEPIWRALTSLPLLAQPSTGGTACMKRCGLDFQETNTFVGGTSPSRIGRRSYQVSKIFD